MKVNKDIYHCTQCKKILDSLSSLLFVETGNVKGYCSEVCIEKYFQPVVEHYDNVEKFLRKQYQIEDESSRELINDPECLEMTLVNPKEIWYIENDLHEKVYSFLSAFKDNAGEEFFTSVLCLVFNNRPSFILGAVSTKNEMILREYRIGEKIEDVKKFLSAGEDESLEGPHFPPEVIESLEQKKSYLLAKLLELRSPTDIPYERFQEFDECQRGTLENPDEVYEENDEDGDVLFIYIKAHEKDEMSFYYFIICMKVSVDSDDRNEMVLPVITFPSIDGELYKKYRVGNLLSGNLKS